MSLQVKLLEQSFNYIKPYGNLFVTTCYDNLFKANPELESLFTSIDPETKKHQLWDDLVLVIDNLQQPDTLNDVLQGLGARLFTYGALPEHYPLVRNALFVTFEQFLGSEWTAELKQAWLEAYVTFREMMLDGANHAQEQIAHETHLSVSEETIEEAVVVTSTDDSLTEEPLETPVKSSEEIVKEEAVVASTVDSLAEEVPETPVAESEEIIQEEAVVIAETQHYSTKELLKTPVLESTDVLEEKFTIAELLEQSFNYIKPYGNLFVTSCYENLFKAHPELESLFTSIDPETKKHQLWDDLVLVIDNLHQPDTLNDALQGLGAKLFTYGALPEHYPLVRNALFVTFEQFLGSEWTAELKQAWLEAYVTFSEMMLDGANHAQEQIAHETHLSASEKTMEEAVVVVASSQDSLAEEVPETPVAASEEIIQEEVVVSSTEDSLAEELLETPMAASEEIIQEEVVVSSTEDSLTEELLETPMAASEEIIQEEVVVASTEDSLTEELLETPVAASEEIIQEEVVVSSTEDSLAEELLETPVAASEEIIQEEVVVSSTEDSLAEELLETPVAASEEIIQEEVIIVDNNDNYPEKITMPESDNKVSKEEAMLEQSQESLEENVLETPLADLSETLKSPTIDPKFTQIFSPESQSESTATATVEKPVASEKTYEPERQSSQSNKKLLVGGGVAGIAGIIWLLIILL